MIGRLRSPGINRTIIRFIVVLLGSAYWPHAFEIPKVISSSRVLPIYNTRLQQHSSASEKQALQSLLIQNSSIPVSEVDILYNKQKPLIYDTQLERYITKKTADKLQSKHQTVLDYCTKTVLPFLSVSFIPAGITENYFAFIRWRIIQRFVNANLHVFGTQSLLLGLGIKSTSSHLGALSAALNWVLKDALGKIVRMLWASQMGRRFDSDAKRWRFRSSFVFAAGNGLEIVTYILPQFFLLWATLANCCKQISMLTSSSTRTAIYNSFRDGSRENIGDITAKGEAQIAIVDLFGIASGVTLSRAVGTSVRSIVSVYVVLQILEIFCMYRQLRNVQYRVLNFERLVSVTQAFCAEAIKCPNGESRVQVLLSHEADLLPTPRYLARHERIFLPPTHLARRAIAFGSLGRTKLSPSELQDLLQIFGKERFLLVVGRNIKNPSRRRWRYDRIERLQENCHIVLHAEATNLDIVKSTLALVLLREKMANSHFDPETVRTYDSLDFIRDAMREADVLFPILTRLMYKTGWESPVRFMFGRVTMRADWPLQKKSQ